MIKDNRKSREASNKIEGYEMRRFAWVLSVLHELANLKTLIAGSKLLEG